ncbi:MAG: Uridylate kinase [Chlamydiae bacterium]|nr:Uridylate kinase [Chlamydiota bacterium]
MEDYKRILVKVSGEALMGEEPFGTSPSGVSLVAEKIYTLHQAGKEVAIVTGGGNFFRGIQQVAKTGLARTPADQVGMLATLMNGVLLKEALTHLGCEVRMMSSLVCPTIADPYKWEKAMRHLKRGRVLLFVGGTGHPYFTTDTTAALRASEIEADIFLKATTRVDGIYDSDPRKQAGAKKYDSLSFEQVLEKKLGILDLSAVTMCMTANIPIKVFNFYEGSFLEALNSPSFGTIVTG